MITRINESKTLTKNVAYDCKCKFHVRKCNSNHKRNNSKCRVECKNPIKYRACKQDYVWNPSSCACEVNKYLKIIIIYVVTIWDEVIDSSHTLSIDSSNEIAVNKMD